MSIKELLPLAFATWKNELFTPKVHFSSPKSCKEFRSHANSINFGEFQAFLRIAASQDRDFDIMLEVKNKDVALLELSSQLGSMKGIRQISEGEFEIIESYFI